MPRVERATQRTVIVGIRAWRPWRKGLRGHIHQAHVRDLYRPTHSAGIVDRCSASQGPQACLLSVASDVDDIVHCDYVRRARRVVFPRLVLQPADHAI